MDNEECVKYISEILLRFQDNPEDPLVPERSVTVEISESAYNLLVSVCKDTGSDSQNIVYEMLYAYASLLSRFPQFHRTRNAMKYIKESCRKGEV